MERKANPAPRVVFLAEFWGVSNGTIRLPGIK
jgi:hypothetical protein